MSYSSKDQTIQGLRSLERIERDIERDFWMSAEEAKSYGMIDMVLGSDTRG